MKVLSLMQCNPASTETTDRSNAKLSSGASIRPIHELTSQSALWRAVLGQAIRDLYGTDNRARVEVLVWIKSRDFDTVCDFAFVEPQQMREQLLAISQLSPGLARKYGSELRHQVMEDVY